MYKIPLCKPSYMSFADKVEKEVCKVIKSGYIAQGRKVEEFEHMMAEYANTEYAIAVSSGTAALYMCLKARNIGKGDNVITTPFTFMGTIFAITQTGATPVFVDIDRYTYNIIGKSVREAYCLEDGNISAVMPVDVFGRACLTRGYPEEIFTILDSCESLGATMGRKFDAQVFAFYPNKQITTGEGGCICTNDEYLDRFCRSYRNQGRNVDDTWLNHSQEGFNFRMTDIQAAIGIEQLNRISTIWTKRYRVLQEYYKKLWLLAQNGLIRLHYFDVKDSPFVFTVEVDNRDKIMEYMLDKGIECRPYFPCVHLQPAMKYLGYKKGDFPVAEEVSSRTLALPFWTDIRNSEIYTVCRTLENAIKEV
jgi:perosamine synthetase